MYFRRMLLLLPLVVAAGLMACGEEQAEVDAGETPDETPEMAVEVVDPAEPGMTEEEKMAFVMENCICPRCPSWVQEASEKGEGGYCLTGMSECILVEAGCICPECPVTLEMGLEWGYYCTRGSVEEMMASQEE